MDNLLDMLTDREREILLLASQGLSNQEIARQLYLALETVKWYNKQIYSKLGVVRRTQAIARAQTLGLLHDDAHPHNLPRQITPFIGRQGEMTELVRLLGLADVRLVSIVGAGGMGKTRLALEAASTIAGTSPADAAFSDGVYLVSLAPISASQHMVSTVADAIGLQFYGQEEPKRQLISFLRRRQMLLVLDNFEHLLDEAGILADLLQSAPGVKILITSRERLNLSGETVFPLNGMDYPDCQTLDDASAYSAVQLFTQTARRLQPDAAFSDDDLSHVARICRFVEGMPLGIMLAASWVATLSPQEIADELSRSLDFLATDIRDVPERHRSMRALFDSTWHRLTQAEQDVFMKLSVFCGSFTRQATEAITGTSLHTLAALVNKSLLQYSPTTRLYEIHELLCQYAAQQLDRSPQGSDIIRQRHSTYYLDFMSEHWPHLKDHRQLTALQEMDVESENIYVAWRYAVKHGHTDSISKAVMGLWFYHQLRSQFQDGLVLFGEAVDALRPTADARALGQLLSGQSWFLAMAGAMETSKLTAQEGLTLLQQSGMPEDLLFAYHAFNHVCSFLNHDDDSMQAAQRGFELARKSGDLWWEAEHLFMLGWSAISADHFDEARQYGEASERIFKTLSNPFGIVRTAGVLLASVAMWTVNYAEARERLRFSIQLYEEIGQTWGIAYAYRYLARMAMWQGEYRDADDYLRQSLRLFEAIGQSWEVIVNLACMAEIFIAQDWEEKAIEFLALAQQYDTRVVIHARIDLLLDVLKAELPADVFGAAMERGKALDVDAVITDLL
jgi:predicted ATPase/DNA-binding CsgD family transcriptional regulator